MMQKSYYSRKYIKARLIVLSVLSVAVRGKSNTATVQLLQSVKFNILLYGVLILDVQKKSQQHIMNNQLI